MPLAVRYVEPKHLCRRPLPVGTKNELEAVAVISLVSVIQQIGSLAKHAESMMGELCDIMGQYGERSLRLQERVNHLKKKVIPRLDYHIQEEADNNLGVFVEGDPFKSDHTISQQLLSISTAPDSLKEQYRSSQEVPPLHQFTEHFATGQNAVHFYSNPRYFFNSWRDEMERKATVTSTKRRSLMQQQQSINMVEEPMEIPRTTSTVKKRSNKPDTSYSATLPLRIKPRKKAKPHLEHAFNSMKKDRQKERKTITSETYTDNNATTSTSTTTNKQRPRGQEQHNSESSGYLSQHSSSSTSLVEQDGASSNVLASDKRSVSTQCMVEGKGGGGGEGKPRVLNRTKSSSSITRKGSSSKLNGELSPATTTPNTKSSPTHAMKRNTLQSEAISPTKLSPLHGPTVSPEIRHKTVDIIRSLSQSSPTPQGIRNSGIFSFPDPIEILRTNPHLNVTSSFSIDEILSTDDLLSATSSQDSMKPRSISNWSPSRPAPSPPTTNSPRAGTKTYSPELRPVRLHSNDTSPILSDKREGGTTPRRKAPPPPSSNNSSKTSSPLNVSPQTIKKPIPQTIPTVPQTTSTALPPLTGIRRLSSNELMTHQKVVKKLSNDKLVKEPAIGNHGNTLKEAESNCPLTNYDTQNVVRRHGNTQGSPPTQRRHSNILESSPTQRRRSNTEVSPPTHRHSNTQKSPLLQRRHSNIQESPPTQRRHSNTQDNLPTQRRQSNTQDNPPTQRRHSNTQDNPPTQRRHSNIKTEEHHYGNNQQPIETQQVVSPPNSAGKKFKGFFTRQSSQETTNNTANNRKSTILKAAGVETVVISNERNKLLLSIRKGIQLKKVQEKASKVATNNDIMPWDVAAILERRQALENSDNELDDGGLVQDNEWDEL